MPAAPERPALRRRYERRRDDVVAQAANVFAVRGYDQTTVQELAAELGIAAGAIYHYFRSKEELLIAICDQLMDPLLEEAREVRDDPELSAADRLRRLVEIWVDHTVRYRTHMLVFQQERHAIETGEQWRDVRASRKKFESILGAALADVEQEGRANYVDRRVALGALLGMVNHTVQWFKPRGRLTPAQIADGYVDLVLRDA